jgi:thermitase
MSSRADVDALRAWKITRDSPDIVVCIYDSGIDSAHEAFSIPGKLVPGKDYVDNDTRPDPTESSHGTSCAGIVAAPWGIGRVVGIAPNCTLMAIREPRFQNGKKWQMVLLGRLIMVHI